MYLVCIRGNERTPQCMDPVALSYCVVGPGLAFCPYSAKARLLFRSLQYVLSHNVPDINIISLMLLFVQSCSKNISWQAITILLYVTITPSSERQHVFGTSDTSWPFGLKHHVLTIHVTRVHRIFTILSQSRFSTMPYCPICDNDFTSVRMFIQSATLPMMEWHAVYTCFFPPQAFQYIQSTKTAAVCRLSLYWSSLREFLLFTSSNLFYFWE